MRKLPDPARAATAPDVASAADAEDGAWLSLQRRGEASELARDRSQVSQEGGRASDELVEELELRLREWVERVDTLETELGYLKRDLEVRIAYTRELERQLEDHVNALRAAANEIAAMRERIAYRVVDGMVEQVARRPALHRVGSDWARRVIAWRER
jgi:chromosome segregation ATPase